ncbi:AI-2E family transporter [Actinospica sp. MGRD01-02]|uniref:AI-2E family transporter n=1 Tax=Actinospica acidithermotolerans TaxID=2828514 RepID=A0A941EE38_9ACTN|nr:AI-2E family transporter [Actinospica acidithermotolerans]MBR7831020.1 AI-2E family transporter [Actinospica acidithermotolerans]
MQERGPRDVSPRLRQVSDYAWRVLLLGAFGYVVFLVAMRFELIFVALFIALIFTSLLRPPVNVLSRLMPRSLALLFTALCGLGLVGGLFWFAGNSVANESDYLGSEFHSGVSRIEKWLEAKPFHVNPSTLSNLQGKLNSYISGHRTTLLNQALNGAGRIVDVLTVLALAFFCSIFFAKSGDRMWHWFQDQLPDSVSPTWQRCGAAAWHTFAGYTRGIILVSAANAVMVGISLKLLHVPLVLPLTLLEFFASFIPLIGSPIAMAVATVVALASQGLTTAIIVVILIVVFGQIEGHVLQPLVMGWAVQLHPVVVAVSVIAGTLSAGLLGAVVAVPLVSITWAVIRELRAEPGSVAAEGVPAETATETAGDTPELAAEAPAVVPAQPEEPELAVETVVEAES